MTIDLDELAATVAGAHAWKTVDDRKVELNASEWDAAVKLAQTWLRLRPENESRRQRSFLIKCLSKIEDRVQRMALALEIFGKVGMEILREIEGRPESSG